MVWSRHCPRQGLRYELGGEDKPMGKRLECWLNAEGRETTPEKAVEGRVWELDDEGKLIREIFLVREGHEPGLIRVLPRKRRR